MRRIPLYTNAQTRELDRVAIEEFGIPGLVLMERAGRAAFDRIMERFGGASPVCVLCGAGNNGGDGYVVARLLRETGVTVSVIATGPPTTPDAQSACESYRAMGGLVIKEGTLPADTALLVDALLGSGLTRAPGGRYADLIRQVSALDCPVVAIDLPSGLSGDTGDAFDPCIRADCTVTFIGRKLGQFTAAGPDHCGELIFESLALEREILRRVEPAAHLVAPAALAPRQKDSHKGRYGHVVVAGGEPGMLGAVLLAGGAALRAGAGLVTVLSDALHLDRPALVRPELMSRVFDPGNEQPAIQLLRAATVTLFGPGTGAGPWSESLREALRDVDALQVWDAGALHLLARDPDHRDERVLTPHPGEAATLLGSDTAAVQRDRPAAATAIQQRFGGVCVLKGAGTVIAGEGRLAICDRGNPGMASAGMGDVLGGVIAALLGQGLSPWDAANSGAWWHGAAGDMARENLGEVALIASDVIRYLPAVMHGALPLSPESGNPRG